MPRLVDRVTIDTKIVKSIVDMTQTDWTASWAGSVSTIVLDKKNELVHVSTEFKKFDFVPLCKHVNSEVKDLCKRCLSWHSSVKVLSLDVAGHASKKWSLANSKYAAPSLHGVTPHQ